MKFLELTASYQSSLDKLWTKIPDIDFLNLNQYLEKKHYEGFAWSDFYQEALTKIGYQTYYIDLNDDVLLKKWAAENGIKKGLSNDDLVFEYIKKIQPDIIWYDYFQVDLLKRIKSEIKSIKLVLGWVGSAIHPSLVWEHIDVILSCAPESVATMQSKGFKSIHLNHAFDSRVLDRIKSQEKTTDLTFVGQLIRGDDFHLKREKILLELINEINLTIFSPLKFNKYKDIPKYLIRKSLSELLKVGIKMGASENNYYKIPFIGKSGLWNKNIHYPVNNHLLKYLKPAVFGIEMYQELANSLLVLNIHADSSPEYASNMRLFETTGVGTCLLTDYKKNITDFFEPEKEILIYNSSEELIEKAKWYSKNSNEAIKIGLAGQKRTLHCHTFNHRAIELNQIIKSNL